MVQTVSDISKVVVDKLSTRETDKQVGYLLRAVEDLGDKLESHMHREEECRERDREEFLSFKDEVKHDNKIQNEQIRELGRELSDTKKDIKKFMAGITIIMGLVGVIADKLDPSVLGNLFSTFFKVFFG